MVVELLNPVGLLSVVEMLQHELWMRSCLLLAARGRGFVSPNPMVGAVLVRGGALVAEGWHAEYGGPHAERMLFGGLDAGEDLSDCILYVSLEPCSHFGKTPPCANLLLERGVKAVVVGVLDPNPLVSGGGVKLLRDAGVEVIVGVLEEACRMLNLSFWMNQLYGRASVMLKWAETGDGFLGSGTGERVMISGAASGVFVQGLRGGVDVILVGVNTWNLDRPRLTVGDGFGSEGINPPIKQPVRIVLDRRLRGEYSEESVLRSSGALWVIYDLGEVENSADGRLRLGALEKLSERMVSKRMVEKSMVEEKFRTFGLEMGDEKGLEHLMGWLLSAHRIGSVMVEGGGDVLRGFLREGMVDEIHVIRNAGMVLGQGVKSPEGIELHRMIDLGGDEHWHWRRELRG